MAKRKRRQKSRAHSWLRKFRYDPWEATRNLPPSLQTLGPEVYLTAKRFTIARRLILGLNGPKYHDRKVEEFFEQDGQSLEDLRSLTEAYYVTRGERIGKQSTFGLRSNSSDDWQLPTTVGLEIEFDNLHASFLGEGQELLTWPTTDGRSLLDFFSAAVAIFAFLHDAYYLPPDYANSCHLNVGGSWERLRTYLTVPPVKLKDEDGDDHYCLISPVEDYMGTSPRWPSFGTRLSPPLRPISRTFIGYCSSLTLARVGEFLYNLKSKNEKGKTSVRGQKTADYFRGWRNGRAYFSFTCRSRGP